MLSKTTKARIKANKQKQYAAVHPPAGYYRVGERSIPYYVLKFRPLSAKQKRRMDKFLSAIKVEPPTCEVYISPNALDFAEKILEARRAANPNNCDTCKYYPDPDATGHCYMFRAAPTEVCMQHTGRHQPITPEFVRMMAKAVGVESPFSQGQRNGT